MNTFLLLLASWIEITTSFRTDCRIDLVMVIDSSGSVQRVFNTYKEAALQFAKDIYFGLEGAHAAIIQYSRYPPMLKYSFREPQSNQAILHALNDLRFIGDSTFTAEAVNLGLDQFSLGGRPDAKKIFVLMTDGNSINQWRVVLLTAKRVHESGANVYVLGLGDNLYYPELKLYAGNGSLVTRDGLNRFKAEVMDIGGCLPPPTMPPTNQPTEYSYSTDTSVPTTRTVSSKPIGLECTIPPGWCPCSSTSESSISSLVMQTTQSSIVESPTTLGISTVASTPTTLGISIPLSPCAVDILFVLDSSGDDRANFNRQIRFILDILDVLVIRPDAHLVGAVVYDGHLKQRIQFSFTAYKDIQSLSKAISNLPFFGGNAATGEALVLAKQAFRDRRGANVPALALVVTNGTSTDDIAGPAADLRAEPNTDVFALSATDVNDKKQLEKIAGSPYRVFAGMESDSIKKIGLGKYLTCFRDRLTMSQRIFLRL